MARLMRLGISDALLFPIAILTVSDRHATCEGKLPPPHAGEGGREGGGGGCGRTARCEVRRQCSDIRARLTAVSPHPNPPPPAGEGMDTPKACYPPEDMS